MKTTKTMKTFRYLLVALIVLLAPLPVRAQYTQINSLSGCTTFGQVDRQYHFHSTSIMVNSGSQLPLAAVSGSSTAGNSPAAYAPTYSRPRRIGEDEGFDENDTDENEPDMPGNPFPVGEGTWFLLLLAAAYGALRLRKLRSAVAE